MTKIYCADTTCKYCKNQVCSKKSINLSQHTIMTLYQGRQEFNRCNKEESEEYIELKKQWLELLFKNTKEE